MAKVTVTQIDIVEMKRLLVKEKHRIGAVTYLFTKNEYKKDTMPIVRSIVENFEAVEKMVETLGSVTISK